MNGCLRIVCADDESVMREYLARILPRLGHRLVGAAADGAELVEVCQRERPDLVISDVRMTEMSGLEAVGILYREEQVPVVFVSAYHDPQLIADADNEFVMEYLVKPVNQEQLGTAIAEVWARFERHRATL